MNIGKLSVTTNHWRIQFYFPGPDFRYNGTFISIDGSEIDQYLKAYLDNWNTFIKLKELVSNTGGEMTKVGEQNMSIRAGGFFEGVCIRHHYLPVSTKEQLEKVIADLKWAKKRANEVMNLLNQI
ncbi:hypothetical protein [Neobacillus sp. NPDC093127]|uniref:hypothetical protein n=1 Tax=Neobacillus sp. NPDC093127 TaxID=3364296 RepID=UPI0038036554